MARNRKRAKERRARRPQPVAGTRTERQAAPDPIGHAAPDVELAEAQMALGRPELTPDAATEPNDATDPETDAELIDDEQFGQAPQIPGVAPDRVQVRSGVLTAAEAAPVPEPRRRPGNRLIQFLQGSWRELQRVQWPDRRQVAQATGVVIGFVIVAGLFLGLADFLSTKLMNYVLK